MKICIEFALVIIHRKLKICSKRSGGTLINYYSASIEAEKNKQILVNRPNDTVGENGIKIERKSNRDDRI